MKSCLIYPVILPKLLIRWGLNPGRLGTSLTLYLKTISLITNIRSILNLNMLRLILLMHSKDLRFYNHGSGLVTYLVSVRYPR